VGRAGLSPSERNNGLLLRKSPWDPALRGCKKMIGRDWRRSRVFGGVISIVSVSRDDGDYAREEWVRIALNSQGLRPGQTKRRPYGLSNGLSLRESPWDPALTYRALTDPTAAVFLQPLTVAALP